MSVVVENPESSQSDKNETFIVYSKGADEVMMPQNDDQDQKNDLQKIENFSKETTKFAKLGLRTLCINKKEITKSTDAKPTDQSHIYDTLKSKDEEKIKTLIKEIEANTKVLGITGVEDKLQDKVPETLEALRNAGIKIWVITGDKIETAISIGKSSNLIRGEDFIYKISKKDLGDQNGTVFKNFDEGQMVLEKLESILENSDCSLESGQQGNANLAYATTSEDGEANKSSSNTKTGSANGSPILVLDGQILQIIFQPPKENETKQEKASRKNLKQKFLKVCKISRSVICSRVTPQQKGQIVSFIKTSLKVQTLAVGDGANDVSMIQIADLGIGVAGKEGLQASMCSDMSIPRFHYLKRLILVHGHLTYFRLVMMILYFMYKNFVFVLFLFWYQFISDFQNNNPVDEFVLIVIHVLFNSLPPLAQGLYDYDVPENYLLKEKYYKLYRQGRENWLYNAKDFWAFVLLGVYQSAVIFLVVFYTFKDGEEDMDYLTFGWLLILCSLWANFISQVIELKKVNLIDVGCLALSIFLVVGVSVLVSAWGLPMESPSQGFHYIFKRANSWLSMILATYLAIVPHLLFRTFQMQFYPNDCEISRQHIIKTSGARQKPTFSNAFKMK